MYCNPLAAEGLFALADEDAKRLFPGREDVTERDLPFDFDPSVNYFAKFDAILPAWRQYRRFADVKGDAALTDGADKDGNGPIELKIDRRTTRTIAYRRYVRAIAPDGSLRQLKISTIRPTPAFPDGLDACSTHTRFVTRKNAKGWIVVEDGEGYEMLWNPYSGLRGQQYAAWAWSVMEYRRARHKAQEAIDAESNMSQALRETRKQTEAIGQMGTAIGKAMAENQADVISQAVSRAVQEMQKPEQRPSRRERGE